MEYTSNIQDYQDTPVKTEEFNTITKKIQQIERMAQQISYNSLKIKTTLRVAPEEQEKEGQQVVCLYSALDGIIEKLELAEYNLDQINEIIGE